MITKFEQINKISARWEPIGKKPSIEQVGVFKARKMQAKLFRSWFDTKQETTRLIIDAATAAGKTIAICQVLSYSLKNNPKQKAIIAVPQTIIADGFRGPFKLEFVDEDNSPLVNETPVPIIDWCPQHYLCDQTMSLGSNISQIQNFLQREGQFDNPNDRILVCSQASLIAGFKAHKSLFKDIIIVIDERHHIYSSQTPEDELEEAICAESYNQLGAILIYSIKHEDKNIGLILSSATPFRGDRKEIIPEVYEDKFHTFFYPMDEYLKDCYWLREFVYDFMMYDIEWGPALTSIFAKSIGKTIVYIPYVRNKTCSYGSKQKDWQEVYRSIAGKDDYEIRELPNGITEIKRNDIWIKVVNLADDSDIILREKRKKIISDAHKYADNSVIDVIIALNMFREGANWKWGDRIIIVGVKGSLTDYLQIIGRILRDAPEKLGVSIINLLPYSFDQLDEDKFKSNLNEYIKTIFAIMLLEDFISPVTIRLPLKRDEKPDDSTENTRTINVDYLLKQVVDENEYIEICQFIMEELIRVHTNGTVDFAINNKDTREKWTEIVSDILEEYDILENRKEIAESLRKRWMRETIKKIPGIKLDEVDFDTIQANPLDGFIIFTSKACNLNSFQEFRNAYEKFKVTAEYNFGVLFPEAAKQWDMEANKGLRKRIK